MKTFGIRRTLVLALPFFAYQHSAEEVSNQLEDEIIEEVLIIGTREAVRELPGSGAIIDSEEMDRFDHVDLNQVLGSVPGLYIREEDGYGLRPNIGIRGASADRSQKITIMEDGVLITPAPYSAPAAYYVPNVARIEAIEVLKGPASIYHGPHTVGGAINFVTRNPAKQPVNEMDLSAGTYGYLKTQGAFGRSWDSDSGEFGFLIDGLRYQSDGFKELDSGGDTGFDRNDVNAKFRWRPNSERRQTWTFKVGYSDEDAHETYLGLTDADFQINPVRRYKASQLARFQTDHLTLHVNYATDLNENHSVDVKVYMNQFDRAWKKLDGFIDGPALQSVLRNPQRYARRFDLLRGLQDSNGTDSELLDVTTNDRSFESMGIQSTLKSSFNWLGLQHQSTVGIRFHTDEVERDHRQRAYDMDNGAMVWDGISRGSKVVNHADSEAVAIWLADAISYADLTMTLGVRFEDIQGEVTNFKTGTNNSANQSIIAPGIGLIWRATDSLRLLGGIYQGFSPAGPGSNNVDPEESVNFEYGVRYELGKHAVDVVGFISDYENLLGRCRVSDFDCDAGDEFNGGEVEISGVEVTARTSYDINSDWNFTADTTYTYTDSKFQSAFLSQFSQWGLVREGDELPYLPRHRAQMRIGIESEDWALSTALKYQAEMREEPGQQDITSGLHAEDYLTYDLTGSWFVNESVTVQVIAQNLSDEAAIVSHRPFGARPNLPRTIIGRLKLQF